MTRPCLAAITFDPAGGGVATASRLLRDAVTARWPDTTVRELVPRSNAAVARFDSSTIDRLRFGVDLAYRQAIRTADWVLYAHPGIARAQMLVPAPLRRPYGVFLHGLEMWRPLTPSLKRAVAGAAVRIANSHVTAARATEFAPDIGPIVVCPLALPPREARTASGDRIDLGPHAVLIVGRMSAAERYKGHDQLLEAWPLVKRYVPDARLVCVGDGDDAARLKKKACALGIADGVTFAGFVSDDELTRFYRGAAVFAMPSRGEGFGLVYLEAMSHRLPCIGSTHDAAREVIADGETGFLVDQDDSARLADRIALLLTDDGRRRRMGERGYDRVQQHFTYERFRTRFIPHLEAAFEPTRRSIAAVPSLS